MDLVSFLHAVLLGIVEGLTEFIPVSSTGHLIMAVDLLGFNKITGKSFEIIVQLGAILAVCWINRQRLIHVTLNMTREKKSWCFVRNVTVAFIPSVVFGFMFYGFIKNVLFSPYVVAVMLIIGGIIIILVERMDLKFRRHSIERMNVKTAFYIGLCQTLSMIPGTSRAGATIIGAMLFSVDRKTATEFSFFLAIPTIMATTVYDIYKNYDTLVNGETIQLILIGFVSAFLSALYVVRWLVEFVSKNKLTPFGWYRIAAGGVMLLLLSS